MLLSEYDSHAQFVYNSQFLCGRQVHMRYIFLEPLLCCCQNNLCHQTLMLQLGQGNTWGLSGHAPWWGFPICKGVHWVFIGSFRDALNVSGTWLTPFAWDCFADFVRTAPFTDANMSPITGLVPPTSLATAFVKPQTALQRSLNFWMRCASRSSLLMCPMASSAAGMLWAPFCWILSLSLMIFFQLLGSEWGLS